MSIENMRSEFEAWYLREYFEGDDQCGMEWLSTEPCGGYRHAEPSKQWKVWQASRAALVVELPKLAGLEKPFTGTDMAEIREDNKYNLALRHCRDAIEAAGVRVKP